MGKKEWGKKKKRRKDGKRKQRLPAELISINSLSLRGLEPPMLCCARFVLFISSLCGVSTDFAPNAEQFSLSRAWGPKFSAGSYALKKVTAPNDISFKVLNILQQNSRGLIGWGLDDETNNPHPPSIARSYHLLSFNLECIL